MKTCESSPGASSVHRSPWTAHRGWAGRPCCPAIRWSASETFLAKQRKIKQKKIKRGKEKNREIDEHSSRETDLRNPPDPIANACEDGPWRQTEVNKNTIDTHISITVLTLYQYKFLNLCLNMFYKFHMSFLQMRPVATAVTAQMITSCEVVDTGMFGWKGRFSFNYYSFNVLCKSDILRWNIWNI